MVSPAQLKKSHAVSDSTRDFIIESRQTIQSILRDDDDRILVIVGPCSIHDPHAAVEYAQKLAPLAKAYRNKMVVIMRAYFEKPRTNIGWKGLINDPNLDGTHRIETGLEQARDVMLAILEMGLPTGSELLDPILPQYYADLICWASIGARTSESQTHREMASGLSMPIGFKNATDGNIDVAVHAIQASRHPQTFIGVTQDGVIARVQSSGNPHAHLIIRGGGNGPNYSSVQMEEHIETLKKSNVMSRILVDCSHGNSRKKAKNQSKVVSSVLNQIKNGNRHIMGVMLESFLHHGSQALVNPLSYGVSITDECIGWEDTTEVLAMIYDQLP